MKSKLLLTLGLFVLLIFPSGLAGSKGMPGMAMAAPEIVVEGKAPSFKGKMATRAAPDMEEYYGIDYDCDGYGDSAVGSPFSDVNGQSAAGTVNVIYGTGKGLTKKGNELWHLGVLGLNPLAVDNFGYSIGSADINDDGCTELIIGSPGRDSGLLFNIGAVYVLWGSKQGLKKTGFTELWGQSGSDFYGISLSWGDFNHDDYFDIAGGATGHNIGSKTDAGAVFVDYGPTLNLSLRQEWHLNKSGIAGKAKSNDFWGYSLFSGDFNGDFYHDLAIGTPFGKIGTKDDVGFVNILSGSATGLTSSRNQYVYLKNRKKGDLLGYSLNTCYCNNDGYEDLILTAIGYKNSTGIGYLLFGSSEGITTTGSQALFDPNGAEEDVFGAAIATIGVTGRFGLYFGSPGADVQIGSQILDNAGAMTLFGTFNSQDYEYKDRNIGTDLNLTRSAGDGFGFSLSVTANKNGYTTLLVSAPGANVDGQDNAGAALSYKVSLTDYTKLTKPLTWHRGKLAGPVEGDGRFAFTLGYQVKF